MWISYVMSISMTSHTSTLPRELSNSIRYLLFKRIRLLKVIVDFIYLLSASDIDEPNRYEKYQKACNQVAVHERALLYLTSKVYVYVSEQHKTIRYICLIHSHSCIHLFWILILNSKFNTGLLNRLVKRQAITHAHILALWPNPLVLIDLIALPCRLWFPRFIKLFESNPSVNLLIVVNVDLNQPISVVVPIEPLVRYIISPELQLVVTLLTCRCAIEPTVYLWGTPLFWPFLVEVATA